MGLPPRPDKAPRPLTIEPVSPLPAPRDTEPSPAMPAELDEATRKRVAAAIARAITAELGTVRISSVPPESGEPPRSSMRAAAHVGGKVGKWGVYASGALALAGNLIVWFVRPEYAGPLAQALKLIAGVIVAAAGGGAPAADAAPARDAPALVAPAPAPPAPDAVP